MNLFTFIMFFYSFIFCHPSTQKQYKVYVLQILNSNLNLVIEVCNVLLPRENECQASLFFYVYL